MTVRSLLAVAVAAAASALVLTVELAEARNPHCAGGIQYVVQAMRDKEKGNTDDYQREIGKAVQQLEQCVAEDPADIEAIGYLGWAYADVDSAGPAGVAFQTAIDGLRGKGDIKKAEWVANNRDSYWAGKFNDGIAKINAAQQAYPDYLKPPADDADKTLKEEAGRNYDLAILSLTHAVLLRPGNPQSLRNLGSVYAFRGEFRTAEVVFREGLKIAPSDSALAGSLKSVRVSYAAQLLDQKKYEEAIGFYKELIKGDAGNSDLHLGLADAHYKRATDNKGDAARPDYKAAGEAYAKAAALKSSDPDLAFNAALSYQNGGDWALAETQWRACLKLRPADVDAMSALGQTLTDQQKFADALKVLQAGVATFPKNKVLHRQLGAVYTRMQNNVKSTEELMVYLALQNGKPVDDPETAAKAAPAGSQAAKTLATLGTPEQVVPWEVDQQKIETWFYWSKGLAYHFQAGALYGKSDWSSAGAATGKK